MLLLFTFALTAHAGDRAAASSDTDLQPAGPVEGPRIINGTDASEDDYPQAGGMIMDMDLDLDDYGEFSLRQFTCSSTLIAPDVVMMAAHCIDELAYTQGLGDMVINEIRWTRQADLSTWDGSSRRKQDWPEDSIAALDWVAHPDFSLRSMELGTADNHDIALLFLDTPITDTPFAYLPTEDETDQIEEGAEVEIVGWGMQVASESATDMPDPGTYAIKEMAATVVGEVDETEFQVGPEEDEGRKCHGDSGGPTFIEVETDSAESLRVVGVTSHSYDLSDCKRKGGVDTRVFAYLDWIDEELRARCEDGTRAWCEEEGIPAVPDPEQIADNDDGESDGESDTAEDVKAGGCCSTGGLPSNGVLGLVAGLALLGRRRRQR